MRVCSNNLLCLGTGLHTPAVILWVGIAVIRNGGNLRGSVQGMGILLIPHVVIALKLLVMGVGVVIVPEAIGCGGLLVRVATS